jgi:hypothetical protein
VRHSHYRRTASSDPAKLAITTFGESRFVARSLVSGTKNLPDFPEFFELSRTISDVFERRSYWHRLWIVQESLLANEAVVICGDRRFSLNMMSLIELITAPNGQVNYLTRKSDVIAADKLLTNLDPCQFIYHWKSYQKELVTG